MATIAADRRYSTGAIAFHWTIAALVIFNLAVGLLHDAVPPVRALMPAHKAVGITVLALSVGRVAWRLAHRPPPLPADVARWERGVAPLMHWLLYLLIIVMPLTGWAMGGGAHPHPFTWLGLPVPPLPVSSAGADAAHSAHVVLGWTMAVLVAIHIAAALRHHWLLRDAVLARMAPELDVPATAAGTR